MSKKDDFSWEKQELPKAYLRLEGILYQTSWVIQKEMERQKKAMEAAQKVIEREVRDKDTWRNGKR